MLPKRELAQRDYGSLKVTKVASGKARVWAQAVQLQQPPHITTKGPCPLLCQVVGPRGLVWPHSLVTSSVCVLLWWVRPLCRLVCINWKRTRHRQEGRGRGENGHPSVQSEGEMTWGLGGALFSLVENRRGCEPVTLSIFSCQTGRFGHSDIFSKCKGEIFRQRRKKLFLRDSKSGPLGSLITRVLLIQRLFVWVSGGWKEKYKPGFCSPLELGIFFTSNLLLEEHFFTTLCWFLPHNSAIQPQLHTYPLPLESPCPPPTHSSRSSQSARLRSPCLS